MWEVRESRTLAVKRASLCTGVTVSTSQPHQRLFENKGEERNDKKKAGDGKPVGIYYGPSPHTRAGNGRKDPSFSIIILA